MIEKFTKKLQSQQREIIEELQGKQLVFRKEIDKLNLSIDKLFIVDPVAHILDGSSPKAIISAHHDILLLQDEIGVLEEVINHLNIKISSATKPYTALIQNINKSYFAVRRNRDEILKQVADPEVHAVSRLEKGQFEANLNALKRLLSSGLCTFPISEITALETELNKLPKNPLTISEAS